MSLPGRDRRIGLLKLAAFVLALAPLARLLWLGVGGRMGANPVEFVTRSTGTWTLVLLCVTLAVTPLRRLSGWASLARLRRMLGLFAFFYACLHLLTYVWLDQWFEFGEMARDIVRRPFVTAGFGAWLLLLPLALTSTDAMMRRLGRRWASLHRLVYAAAALALLHFWWHKSGKQLYTEPLVYTAVVAALLAPRLVARLQRGSRRSSA